VQNIDFLCSMYGTHATLETAAAQRLHHNVLATALANKLARIAWTVLAQGRSYEARVKPGAA
jgi:transposase